MGAARKTKTFGRRNGVAYVKKPIPRSSRKPGGVGLKRAGRPASPLRGRRSVPPKWQYDVFLCHNSADKAMVRRLAAALRKRGLRPWFDEWHLVPGKPWQEALERTIQSIGCVAVLVGESGIGPWADREMRAFLNEFVRRDDVSVIPVMLPGAPARTNIPVFLSAFTWIDMRGGIRKAGIDRLVWGVTGIQP